VTVTASQDADTDNGFAPADSAYRCVPEGADPSETQPNWIVSPWPPEFSSMLEWQWNERGTPAWTAPRWSARRMCGRSSWKISTASS